MTQPFLHKGLSTTFFFSFLFVNSSRFFRTIDSFFGMLKDLKRIKIINLKRIKKNKRKKVCKKRHVFVQGHVQGSSIECNLCQIITLHICSLIQGA